MFVIRRCALALGALAITAVSIAVLSPRSPTLAAEPGDDESFLVAQAGKKTPKKTPPKADPKTDPKGPKDKPKDKPKDPDDGPDGTPPLGPTKFKSPHSTWLLLGKGAALPIIDASALHYRSSKAIRTLPHDADCACNEAELSKTKSFRTTPLKTLAATDKAPWNSKAGRLRSEKLLHIGSRSDLGPLDELLPPGPADPCAPKVWAGGGEFTVPDTSIQVLDPGVAFAGQTPAKNFAKSVGPFMPFYLPFKQDVVLSQGWYYDKGTSHAALDYGIKDEAPNGDATFKVTSVASGKVIAVYWANLSGNMVIVQHTAPNGYQYLSIYKHMRNGRSHDVAKAKAIDPNTLSGGNKDKAKEYVAFAKDFSTHVSWGTEAHTIQVKVGDKVGPGTLLGYAGNTGYGGASAGLNPDGSPTSKRGNVHLHFEFAAELKGTPDTFVTVDPYGAYCMADSNGCYDLLRDTEYPRLFAPFYPHFHGVPVSLFLKYFNYFPDMGYDLQTFSVHTSSKGLLCSGSFQKLPGGWYLGVNMDGKTHQEWFDKYWDKGYVPRQTQVTVTPSGEPRFTALWRKVEPGEAVIRRRQLSNAEWADHWQKYVGDKKWRVDDYFGFVAGGTPFQSATFTSDEGRPFKLLRNRTLANLVDEAPQHKADGYFPVGMSAVDLPEGRRYSVLLRKQKGDWKLYIGLSPSEYQQTFETESDRGYDLHRIQGYANSTLYAAIFHRP